MPLGDHQPALRFGAIRVESGKPSRGQSQHREPFECLGAVDRGVALRQERRDEPVIVHRQPSQRLLVVCYRASIRSPPPSARIAHAG